MNQPNINPSEQNINREPVISPNQSNLPNKSNLFSKILIAILLLVIFLAAGIILGKTYFSPQTPIIAIPTIAPIIPPADSSANWKTYTNDLLEFKYPQGWKLLEQDEGRYVGVEEGEINPLNMFIVETREKTSLDTAIDYIVNYEIFSTAGFGDFFPQEVGKSEIIVGGVVATKYVYKLNNPQELEYDEITRIFVPYQQGIVILQIDGKDKGILDQILSTFKFTDQNQGKETNIIDDNSSIKNALLLKINGNDKATSFAVEQNTGEFAKGKGGTTGSGFEWGAAKVNGQWVIVFADQQYPPCANLDKYNFPNSLALKCYSANGKEVSR